ncbi:MAG: hypothetical protein JOZ05_20880 [Acetobacteraceae bacterium]|nr:hypothetical protein [Acetobacteraceae bacterium]
MGKILIGAALLAGIGIGAAGVAVAQTPPPGGPDGPGAQGPGGHPPFPPGPPGMGFGMGGPGRPPGPHGMMMMRPPRGAVFAFRRGDTRIMIKCSDEESTRACVDGASALLDKVGSMGGTTSTTTPTR